MRRGDIIYMRGQTFYETDPITKTTHYNKIYISKPWHQKFYVYGTTVCCSGTNCGSIVPNQPPLPVLLLLQWWKKSRRKSGKRKKVRGSRTIKSKR